jgi:hypothetical protein
MKEVNALAKYLRLMIALDSEPLLRVHSPEALHQPRKNILLRQWLYFLNTIAPILSLGL